MTEKKKAGSSAPPRSKSADRASFKDIRTRVRAAHLTSPPAYARWRRTRAGRDTPNKPWLTYPDDWGGWADFLGPSFESPRVSAKAFRATRELRQPRVAARGKPPARTGQLMKMQMSRAEPVMALTELPTRRNKITQRRKPRRK